MKNVYHATSKKFNISQFNENKQLLLQATDWAEDLVIAEIPEIEYLLSQIPEEFRSTLSYMAYEKSHAYGEEETNLTLKSLILDLKPSIDKFEARVRAEKR